MTDVRSKNVYSKPLHALSTSQNPLPGADRSGFCRGTDASDPDNHSVGAILTSKFLDFTASKGNDLRQEAGVQEGQRWCLCASRWREAFEAADGDQDEKVPKVMLHATGERALDVVGFKDLKKYASEPEASNAGTHAQEPSSHPESPFKPGQPGGKEPKAIRIPYINTPFEYVAGPVGASVDDLKLVVCLILSYPLAAILKRIPDSKPHLKNIFTICVSLFFLVGVYDLWSGLRTLLVTCAGAYIIARYLSGPVMPWLGFFFLMGHMSINHVYRHRHTAPGEFDHTGAQMVLVMKLSAFCWNVHDGRLKEQDIGNFQKEHRIKEIPNLLDYMGYCFFFPGLLIGPAFDYIDYKRYIETSMFDIPPGVDPIKAPPRRKNRRVPQSGVPAAKTFAAGVVWIFVFLILIRSYNTEVVLSSDFTSYNFLRRIWMIYMFTFVARAQYYGAWSLAEGSCILSGITYKGINEKTGRVDWDRLQNIRPLGVELAQNTRAFLGNWNINTNNWLRNYVYLRVTPKGEKPGFLASLSTFGASAFWHGFMPGYYLTFILGAFLQTVAKHFRRWVRPFFLHPFTDAPLPSKRYYDFVSWVATQMALSFCVAPFLLLQLHNCMQVWAAVYFYVLFGVALSLGFFNSPGKDILRRRLAERAKAAGISTPRSSTPVPDKSRAELEQLMPGQQRENVRGPHLGLPEDPGAELDGVMHEIRKEVEARRSRGQSLGQGLQEVMTEKVEELRKAGGDQSRQVADQLDGVLDGTNFQKLKKDK
ncbi:MAG: hypothetical protein Q9159_001951 [Coniocarpon cinnabarinum]